MITIIIIILIIDPFLGMLNSSFLFCFYLDNIIQDNLLAIFWFPHWSVGFFPFFNALVRFFRSSSTCFTAHLFCFHIHSNSSFLVLFMCLYHFFLWNFSAFVLSCKSRLTLSYIPRWLFAYVPKILSWIKQNLSQIQ